ncbi:MAG: phage major capsid protein [Candidatus Nanopelagicales bacterium]
MQHRNATRPRPRSAELRVALTPSPYEEGGRRRQSRRHRPKSWDFRGTEAGASRSLLESIRSEAQPERLFGKPIVESSTMTSAQTSGSVLAIVGDFSAFCIVDHIAGAVMVNVSDISGTSGGRGTAQVGWLSAPGWLCGHQWLFLQIPEGLTL